MTGQRIVIEPRDDGGVVVTVRGCPVALIVPWWNVASHPNRYVMTEND
jgi:antitoxin (DNA-binding transcriptional repressor) of toxin-antitoxin stability system